MIGALMAGRRRGHIRNHQIRRAADGVDQSLRCVRIEEVELQNGNARQRRHFQEIDCSNADILFRRSGDLGGNLRPASRRSAEIDDAACALEDMVLLVDLQQLEGSTGAVAFKLGTLPPPPPHIRIVDMPLQPLPRGGFQLLS